MKKLHGYCSVIALTHASGWPESHVLDICRWHGFKDNGQGMEDDEIAEAAKDLGIRKRKITLRPCNVGQFLKKYPVGTFLVTTYNHIFVALNGGIVVHPLQGNLGRRCKVEGAWRVL